MGRYILGIDQGTTGTTALLIDKDTFQVIDSVNHEHPLFFPQTSWVEHDLNLIWKTVESTTSTILKRQNLSGKEIAAIGISNQRETTCAFNRKGEPLAKAIVWQDRRTHAFCEGLKKANKEEWIQQKTGLVCDPYFSGTKIKWLQENDKNVQQAKKADDLLFGTIDTYLLYKLTNGKSFATEPSNASRTLLMNIHSCQWDPELLGLFEVDSKNLPVIKDTFGHYGKTQGLSFLPDNIPVTCLFGDQQSALFGQGRYTEGGIKCTYGTGAFVLMNTGDRPLFSQKGLLTTVAYQNKGHKSYALEGSTYIAGAAVQWLRDKMKFITKSSDVEALAQEIAQGSLEQIKDLLFYPFFTGIGSPYWKSEAKAAILGMTRETGAPHLAYVTLEGIAQSIEDLLEVFQEELPGKVTAVDVDGGACANNLLMQMQANFSKVTIVRPQMIETTAMGAALGALAGLENLRLDEVTKLKKIDREFKAITDTKTLQYYADKRAIWKQQLKQVFLS